MLQGDLRASRRGILPQVNQTVNSSREHSFSQTDFWTCRLGRRPAEKRSATLLQPQLAARKLTRAQGDLAPSGVKPAAEVRSGRSWLEAN